jgi:hypothetical protein
MHSLVEHLLELSRVSSDCDFSRLWEGIRLYGFSSFSDTGSPEASLFVVFHCLLQLLLLRDIEIFLNDLEDVVVGHLSWLLDGHGEVVFLSHRACQKRVDAKIGFLRGHTRGSERYVLLRRRLQLASHRC